MSKKVSELLQELDITFQELKEYSDKLGIEVKTQRSSVEDQDATRLESTIRIMKGTSESASADNRPKIKATPMP